MKKARFCLCLLFLLASSGPALAAVLPDGDAVELDSEVISEQKVRTVQELLNLIPGVKAGSSSVSIRGNSSVAVFLDGMSLINTASSHRSVKWDLVSLEDIASLKVLKGGGRGGLWRQLQRRGDYHKNQKRGSHQGQPVF